MVLVHLLHKLGYDIYMAHCNFNLRGKESDGDEKFIRDYADKNGIKLFVINFDTNKYATEHKVSIQIAARQLRYAWFNELLVENKLDYLLTAHHLDDSLETFLINFSRGTGLEGLTGIPQQNGNIVRPLLGFTRSEIETYVKENNIEWREDSSNASDKYLRNKLRHDVAPVLKSLNPAFMASFLETIEHLQQAQSMVEDASVLVYRQVVTEGDKQKHFSIDLLKRLPNYKAYMYQWLSPFGFTAWNDIYNLVDAQSGKQILSGEYRLLKDRDILILEPLKKMGQLIYEIAENTQKIEVPLSLLLQKVDETDAKPAINTIFVDAGQLKFPLFVRKWQEGDYFCPLGMNGQKKKVSKYFKDEKLSLSDKEDAWLLCSEDRIVWIINMRADERFKVTNKTTQILKIEV
jgi:tRNA(Ile)-lysidine synthase